MGKKKKRVSKDYVTPSVPEAAKEQDEFSRISAALPETRPGRSLWT